MRPTPSSVAKTWAPRRSVSVMTCRIRSGRSCEDTLVSMPIGHPGSVASVEAVDVLIPTRNRLTLTVRAVRSALAQADVDVNVFVVDDASDDDSFAELVNVLRHEPRVRFYSNPRRLGPTLTRQVALDHGGAEWIAPLDSDDEWLPGKLAAQISRAQTSAADVVLCWFAWIRPDGTQRVIRRPVGEGRVSPALTNNIGIPLARRKLVASIGGFAGDDGTPRHRDEHIDFMIRLLAAAEVSTVQQVLVHCHDHAADRASDGITSSVDSLRSILTHRAHLFAGYPDDLALLRMKVAARYLESGARISGLREFTRALRSSSWRGRGLLLREFGPFTLKRMLWRSGRDVSWSG